MLHIKLEIYNNIHYLLFFLLKGDIKIYKIILTIFRITSLSQEIGTVTTKSGQKINYERYPIGSQLFINPWHVSMKPTYSNFGYPVE